MADAGAFLMLVIHFAESGRWQGPAVLRNYEESLSLTTEAGSLARTRFEQQRVMRPSQLQGRQLAIGPDVPSPGWSIFWRLIKSVAAFVGETDLERVERCAPTVDLDPSRLGDELEETLDKLEAGTTPEEAVSLSRTAVERFPWSSILRWELAIRLDEAGATDAARGVIVEALTLTPDNPDLWQSAEVILTRSGAETEAQIAAALGHQLRARKPALTEHDGLSQ